MNYQEYKKIEAQIEAQISELESRKSAAKNEFIESMQAQGWAYVNTEFISCGETHGIAPRLLSPNFLERHGATRETIEGSYTYEKNGRTFARARVDDFEIDWDEEETDVIYL